MEGFGSRADPYLQLVDPDADPRGSKTYGSGSGMDEDADPQHCI